MSVMMLPVELYEDVMYKMRQYEEATMENINYCKSAKMKEAERLTFVQRLCILNELSEAASFCDNAHKVTLIYQQIDKTYRGINTYQMLQHLICIEYQIERKTIEKSKHYVWPEWADETLELLKKITDEIKMRIIESLPQFEATLWGHTH